MERTFRITVENSVYTVTVDDLGSGAVQTQAVASGIIHAPVAPVAETALSPENVKCRLGGVVDSIEVIVGQSVNKGDKVVVIEAMKMKTPMFATRSGVVSGIAVKAGQKIDTGQVLLTIA
ncbi:MAG: biotin/lipoyl-containing protein [Desulfuromonadales bacterium]